VLLSSIQPCSRIGIVFFFDQYGIVDEYFYYLLNKLRPHVSRLLVVINGSIEEKYRQRLSSSADDLIIRENKGFDAWAYREALSVVGYDQLASFDEALLLNHTFFGPLFPFEELFDAMAVRDCDFWGISAHREITRDLATARAPLPFHLNSHFVAIRRSVLQRAEFRSYWDGLPPIESYDDAIQLHEVRLTRYLQELGFKCEVYMEPGWFDSDYGIFDEVDVAIERRCPVLKRRLFFHDPAYMEAKGVNLPRALELLAASSDYDASLIWANVARTTKPRVLATNAALTRVIPKRGNGKSAPGKIAVLVHAYYPSLFPEILSWLVSIPNTFDLFITTDSREKTLELEAILMNSRPRRLNRAEVRTTGENRGRDFGPLLITCRDIILDGPYDLLCRLHTKKVPQIEASRGRLFKQHMYQNLLASEAYVGAILEMFRSTPRLGLVFPPAFHISYGTHGGGWSVNKQRTGEVLKKLNVHVPLDDDTPVAPYGGMFWSRPGALRRIAEYEWSWSDFETEPLGIDGGLAHALERSIAYAAMEDGYIFTHVMDDDHAALNYSALEYKLQKTVVGTVGRGLGVRRALRILRYESAGALNRRAPRLAELLRRVRRASVRLLRRG
jgi:rhamnosyltransferase